MVNVRTIFASPASIASASAKISNMDAPIDSSRTAQWY
jgi:hypothetical protein